MAFAVAGSAYAAPKAPAKLSFWVFQTKGPFDFLSQLVDRYNAANADKLEVATESVPFDQYTGTKLTTAFAAGDGPDIFLVSAGTMSKYIASGVAYPLDAYFDAATRADFGEHGLDSVVSEGKIYGVPMEIDLYGLYYDKAAFAAAGLNPPRTWDELKADAIKLRTPKRAGVTFETVKGAYQNCSWFPFMWMAGGDVFSADRKRATLDSKGVIDALQLWRDLMNSGAANVKPSRTTGSLGILLDGETAMQVCGTWSIASIKPEMADRIGLVPLPAPTGGKPASVAGGWKLMVNAKGADPDAAAKFAVWAFAKNIEAPLSWVTQQKFCYSPRKTVMAAGKDVYHQGLRAVFTDQILGTERPEIRMPAEASSIVEDMIQSAIFDTSVDVQTIAKRSNARMDAFIKDFGKPF